MLDQLMVQATVKPEVLSGKPNAPEFGIEDFCLLTKRQQDETMRNHVQRITKDL